MYIHSKKKASGKKKYLSVILFKESIEKRKLNEIQTNFLMEYEMWYISILYSILSHFPFKLV